MGSGPTDRLSEIPELVPSQPRGAAPPERQPPSQPPSAPKASGTSGASSAQSGARRASAETAAEGQPSGPAIPYMGSTIDLGDDFSDEPIAALPVADLAVEREPLPTGKTPDTLTVHCDPAAVAKLAGYGEAKSGPIGSVVYFARVMRRRKPIAAELTAAREKLNEAEDARDRELVRFVVQLQPILQASPQCRPLITELVGIDETLRQSEQRLSSTRETAQGELEGLQTRREELRAELKQRGDRERQRATDAAETERARKREEARLSRIQIEVRSLKKRSAQEAQAKPDAEGEGDTEGVADAESREREARLADQVAKLEEEARAIQPEVGTAREMDAQAQSRLRAAREARVQIQREIANLDAHVESSNEDAAAKLGSAKEDVRDVRKKGRTAYADVARRLLADADPWNTESIDFSAVRATDAVVSRCAESVALAERAPLSRDDEVHDEGRKNILLLAFLIGALAVTLIVLAIV